MEVIRVIATTLIAASPLVPSSAIADGYQLWQLRIGMRQWEPGWGSDMGTALGVESGSTGWYDAHDTVHAPQGDPNHDLAWIYVADRGGDGGWDEFTGEFRDYPRPGLFKDIRAPYGPGTTQPDVRKRTWAVEVHAPNPPEYAWDLVWETNTHEGRRLPEYPFVVRILPNSVFPQGLDLTSYGDGHHEIMDLPQWGPEPRIWLIEAVVPEPALTYAAVTISLVLIAALRRY